MRLFSHHVLLGTVDDLAVPLVLHDDEVGIDQGAGVDHGTPICYSRDFE